MPALIRALRNAEGNVRQAAVRALGQIGPAAEPALLAALGDPEEGVRQAAAEALKWIRSSSA